MIKVWYCLHYNIDSGTLSTPTLLYKEKSGSRQTFIIKRLKLPSKCRKDSRLAHPLDSALRQSRALRPTLPKARGR